MRTNPLSLSIYLVVTAFVFLSSNTFAQSSPYSQIPASRDGVGKSFMGREIAKVMGHFAADWLERPERIQEERPDVLIAELDLKPGMIVADIGAGTGYHASRIAPLISTKGNNGNSGKVFAVDIQPEMLALLDKSMKRQGLYNVTPVLGSEKSPKLATASVDLIIMVDVYHELEYPAEMLRAMVDALKPNGRIAFVEFKEEDPSVPIKPAHKMSEAQIRKEASAFGLQWLRTAKTLPWQHLVIFRKP
jgi:ubiquinone/menaquinone biosynthesis C-methylase UbiE